MNLVKLKHLIQEVLFTRREKKILETESVEDFWEAAHVKRAHLWLTGSSPQEVINRLGVGPQLSNAIESHELVLDVGVGEGLMARHLSRLGARHDALDISAEALNRVKNLANSIFNVDDALPQRTYSVIMHHLVAQHMSHAHLRDQLASLWGSLNEGGVLSVQYASSRGQVGIDTPQNQKMGLVFRTQQWFEDEVAVQMQGSERDYVQTDDFGEVQFWRVRFTRL